VSKQIQRADLQVGIELKNAVTGVIWTVKERRPPRTSIFKHEHFPYENWVLWAENGRNRIAETLNGIRKSLVLHVPDTAASPAPQQEGGAAQ
jgi:hypothetical protein